jgi:p-cumate 2,3-dioxygenase alpha subunit
MSLPHSVQLRPHDWIAEDKETGVFSILATIYTDPDIHGLERARIFDKCWLYAGHESEVSKNGDFLTRRIGGRQVLIVRGKDGCVRAFLNSCRHKGAPVCREQTGNAALFRCNYHAWTYNNQGVLVSVPGKEAYGPDFVKSGRPLVEVRLASYRSLLFTCYDESTISLGDYLGSTTEMLDLILDQHEETTMSIVPGAYQYNMSSNWKLLMENSMDAYHLWPVHGRFFNEYMPNVLGLKMRREDVLDSGAPYTGVRDLGNGHCVTEIKRFIRSADAQKLGVWEARFGPERAKRMLEYHRNVMLYPNTIIAEQFGMIRSCYPLSADRTESSAWALAPNGEDPTVREKRLQSFSTFQGPAGFGTPDDIELLEQCQTNFHAASSDTYIDSSRGMLRAVAQPDDEVANRILLREWRRQLAPNMTP